MVYEALLDVYGKPFTAVVKASGRFRWNLPRISNSLKAGVEWDMSKNFGRGQVYDLERPITAGNTGVRAPSATFRQCTRPRYGSRT